MKNHENPEFDTFVEVCSYTGKTETIETHCAIDKVTHEKHPRFSVHFHRKLSEQKFLPFVERFL